MSPAGTRWYFPRSTPEPAWPSFREWLPADSLEGILRLAGSLRHSNHVEDYYRTPFDLGYGRFVGTEHDYTGKEALAALRDKPALNKVTLQWNRDDAAGLLAEMLTPGGKDVRALHLPTLADKLEVHYDRISCGGADIRGYLRLHRIHAQRAVDPVACARRPGRRDRR